MLTEVQRGKCIGKAYLPLLGYAKVWEYVATWRILNRLNRIILLYPV